MARLPGRRMPVQERVEENLRAGAYAALRTVFAPLGVDLAPDHRFPFRVEAEVVPLGDGKPGEYWHSLTAYPHGLVVDGTGEAARLLVACDDLDACVRTFATGLNTLKERHDGKKPTI